MKIPKNVHQEAIKATFNYYRPTKWTPFLNILVFDSDIYDVREFGIVYNKSGILYWGYDINTAYFSYTYAPNNDHSLEISYIRDYKDDSYIFFDKEGNNLNNGYKFILMDNMEREIIAKTEDRKFFIITIYGPKVFD